MITNKSGFGSGPSPAQEFAEDLEMPADPVPQPERRVPRPALPGFDAEGSAREILLQMGDLRTDIHLQLGDLADRISALEQSVDQLQGQQVQTDNTLATHWNAIVGEDNFIKMLSQRFNALAQQVGRNERVAVMDIASKARQPGEKPEAVVKLAEAFLLFVQPPQPDTVASAAQPAPTDEPLLPPGTTSH